MNDFSQLDIQSKITQLTEDNKKLLQQIDKTNERIDDLESKLHHEWNITMKNNSKIQTKLGIDLDGGKKTKTRKKNINKYFII